MDGFIHIQEIYCSGYHLGTDQVFNGNLETHLSLQNMVQSLLLMNLCLEKTGICAKLDPKSFLWVGCHQCHKNVAKVTVAIDSLKKKYPSTLHQQFLTH